MESASQSNCILYGCRRCISLTEPPGRMARALVAVHFSTANLLY